MEIKTGLPQGAILGPLFSADDITIYFNLEDFPLLNRHIEINTELDKVNTWLKVNKLSLNVEKNKVYDFP